MKKLLTLVFIATVLLINNVSGQDVQKPQKVNLWSVSVSHSPKLGFNLFGSFPSQDYDESYLLSFDFRIINKISKKASYSLGVNYGSNKKHVYNLIFDGPGSDYFTGTNLIEVPMQFNFHLSNTSKRIDPYIKAAIRNCFFYKVSDGMFNFEPYNVSSSKYFLFSDLGLGTFFILNDKYSIILESSIGYGLIYNRPYLGYSQMLFGLNYTFQK